MKYLLPLAVLFLFASCDSDVPDPAPPATDLPVPGSAGDPPATDEADDEGSAEE